MKLQLALSVVTRMPETAHRSPTHSGSLALDYCWLMPTWPVQVAQKGMWGLWMLGLRSCVSHTGAVRPQPPMWQYNSACCHRL